MKRIVLHQTSFDMKANNKKLSSIVDAAKDNENRYFINTRTKESAIELYKIFKKYELTHRTNVNFIWIWDELHERTCYTLDGEYSELEYYKNKTRAIEINLFETVEYKEMFGSNENTKSGLVWERVKKINTF